ncbi:hypothetical protein [Flavivirga eckloniae]|uniref:DUF5020 domain-containing protein n=1 Tax=Flavivirga eckloniae TaxID=1803846 RepID=A0A2K9PSG5_9FLAO|nr:hypothetical protein [Flavivirga eckloniae]AUP80001.1 hypothetical protein C1H87_15340 [Flavivirga eckloniae]
MKKTVIILLLNIFLGILHAQDANNPIDPSPTLGVFNRFYDNDFSKTQLIANVTFSKWFVRFSAEEQFNYNGDNEFKATNLLVSRLFTSKNEKNKYGFGAIISYIDSKAWAGGINFVSVSKLKNKWKVITLTTLQSGSNIFAIEFQPGIYKNYNNGWYLRSHPRMLFDFETDKYEVPFGAGIGKIFDANWSLINLLFEPQYDFYNGYGMLYIGIKILWK